MTVKRPFLQDLLGHGNLWCPCNTGLLSKEAITHHWTLGHFDYSIELPTMPPEAKRLIDIARAHKGWEGTHWEGCEINHPACLALRLADEVEKVLAPGPITQIGGGTHGDGSEPPGTP